MGTGTKNIRIADKILETQSNPDPAKIYAAACGGREKLDRILG